jgi:hypothetical protein
MDHHRAHGRKKASSWSRPKGETRTQANQATRGLTHAEERAAKADPAADVPEYASRETLHDGSNPLTLSWAIRVF